MSSSSQTTIIKLGLLYTIPNIIQNHKVNNINLITNGVIYSEAKEHNDLFARYNYHSNTT